MTTRLLRPETVADIDGTDYVPREGDVTLDSSAVPYARASLSFPLFDDTTLEFLDPVDGVRVPFVAGDGVDSRSCDLGLRSRRVDPAAKTVVLELASDEAILQKHTALADDRAPLNLTSSLRDVVEHVLDAAIAGATLEAGDDADVTPLWDATNLIGNPSFEASSSTGYQASTNVSGFTYTTSAGFIGPTGIRALRYTSTAAGNSRVIVGATTATFKVTPGRTYWFSFYHRSSVARSGQIGLRFYNADGDQIKLVQVAFSSSSSSMDRFSAMAQAPAGAASVQPDIITLSNSAGQFHYLDCVMLTEGEFLPEYFDGASSDTSSYDYEWAASANASQSIRTKLVDAPAPDAFVWRAGQAAWDFLMPLCATAGMVLWCDENRDWRLQTPEDRAIPSAVFVSPLNTRDATDTIDLDADSTVTGVVLIYTWIDADGIGRRMTDSAGSPTNPLVVELAQPYPGPGAAAVMLARQQGSGRAQDVTCITDWTATPGMSVSISVPGAPDTNGRLVRVRFSLGDGFMDLGSAGLVDTIPGSIATLTGTIAALAGTIASL